MLEEITIMRSLFVKLPIETCGQRNRGRIILPLLFLTWIMFLSACAPGIQDLPPKPEDGVLIYAALNPIANSLRTRVDSFNKNHEDVQIELRD